MPRDGDRRSFTGQELFTDPLTQVVSTQDLGDQQEHRARMRDLGEEIQKGGDHVRSGARRRAVPSNESLEDPVERFLDSTLVIREQQLEQLSDVVRRAVEMLFRRPVDSAHRGLGRRAVGVLGL